MILKVFAACGVVVVHVMAAEAAAAAAVAYNCFNCARGIGLALSGLALTT